MKIRDRIKELRRIRAADLRPHPKNWRLHSETQKNALQGILAEVGYADALLARELEDGTFQIVDGHLRAETTPEALVPVLILDVNEEEAAKILATHDPLASLASTDHEKLEALLGEVATSNPAMEQMLESLSAGSGKEESASLRPELTIPEVHQIVIECSNEQEQREIYEQLTLEGYRCRVLTL